MIEVACRDEPVPQCGGGGQFARELQIHVLNHAVQRIRHLVINVDRKPHTAVITSSRSRNASSAAAWQSRYRSMYGFAVFGGLTIIAVPSMLKAVPYSGSAAVKAPTAPLAAARALAPVQGEQN